MTDRRTRRASKPRRLTKTAAGLAAAAALVFAGATTANAHVTIAEGTVTAGKYATLTFAVPHGCDGSATTKVAMQIPTGVNTVVPTRNAFYTVDTVSEQLDSPATDSHGNTITSRVSQVVYTATTPLPSTQRDTFSLLVKVPEDAAGTTLYFPTVQTCERGEHAWVQIPVAGQDAHDLDAPSPQVRVVAAQMQGATDAPAADAAHAAGAADASMEIAAAASDQTPLILTSLGVGAAGLVVAITALILTRKRTA